MAKTTNKFHAAMLQDSGKIGEQRTENRERRRATELDVQENCLPVWIS